MDPHACVCAFFQSNILARVNDEVEKVAQEFTAILYSILENPKSSRATVSIVTLCLAVFGLP